MMNLENIMKYNNFCVVGNTTVEDKYAYKIKHELLTNGYNVSCVGYELLSLNDVLDLEVVVMCIHPVKGLKLLQECSNEIKAVLIQPGAESDEIFDYLNANKIPYVEGCALVGVKLYKI